MRAPSSISSIMRVWLSLVPRWRRRDHARRAVLAALRLQECLRVAGPALGPGAAKERTVCLSMHAGEVIVGPIGADPRQIALAVGDTTQVADQLRQLAEPELFRRAALPRGRLVQDFIRLDIATPVNVPGVTALHTVYKVLDFASRHIALEWQGRRIVRQFVGREREMGTLHALLAQAAAGHGQVVGIAGELWGSANPASSTVSANRCVTNALTYLAGRCVSYGQATPYLPLLDLLRQACGLTERDTPGRDWLGCQGGPLSADHRDGVGVVQLFRISCACWGKKTALSPSPRSVPRPCGRGPLRP